MSKQGISNVLTFGTILGLVVITFVGVFLIHRSESFGANLNSLSLPGASTSELNPQGPQPSGPGSFCGTLSLAYVCRQLAVDIPLVEVAKLVNDKGTGVSMRDLARGAKSLGLKAKGIRTDLEGLKALAKPVIAFLPELKHFVVVSKADDHGVTCIDLSGPNTLAWYTPDEFADEWNGEVLAFGNVGPEWGTFLSEGEMAQHIGGLYGPCNKVIQEEGVYKECENLSNCAETEYLTLFERYGCAETDNCDDCTEDPMSRGYEYPCVGDEPTTCEPYFEATPTLWGSIDACK